MSDISYRLLTPEDFPQMYRSFLQAFSQYSVNMHMSEDAFSKRMKDKLNINYTLSPAAFDGDKLVGFIFHGDSIYQEKRTAYNGGTGVIPEYWGQGITQRLFDYCVPILKSQHIECCLLEVLTTNEQAIKAYSKAGFRKTRKFKCFKLLGQIPKPFKADNIEFKIQENPNIEAYKVLASAEPSMLDSFGLLEQNLKNELCLEAYFENQLAGYLIYQPQLGRISQLGVSPPFRRQKIGTLLMQSAQENATIKTLSVLNVDDNQKELLAFLEKLGFENQLVQWEMELVF